MPVTASMLYDAVQCPHRVSMDTFGDPTRRDPVSPFVRLLWDRGMAFEQDTIDGLGASFLDLSHYKGDEKDRQTLAAMQRGEPLVYAGRVTADDLVGEPDLLRREEGGYVPVDIKSGAGEEGADDDRKPKRHYAVQLALYVDVLERIGRSAGRRGFIWDVHGEQVLYDLSRAQGPRTPATWWDEYQSTLETTRSIVGQRTATLPAYASICKQCHWRSACVAHLEEVNDLTLIPELGRSKRDTLVGTFATVAAMAVSDPAAYRRPNSKTTFTGIGFDTLAKFQRRADLLCTTDARPYLTAPVTLPSVDRELFFDIELDPMRDVCYLHGFVERLRGDNAGERYVAFFADDPTPSQEEQAFAQAWAYVQQALPCAIYYYSPYERTHWRRLQQRYSAVCSADAIENVFSAPSTVDLYTSVIRRVTEWPTHDHSIKTLARHLGFQWRDTEPSGAASIEWFHRWVETRDPTVRQRLLDYNEDDCRATRVLLDGVRRLAVCN